MWVVPTYMFYRNIYTYIASVQIAVDRANDGSERDEQCTPDPRFWYALSNRLLHI